MSHQKIREQIDNAWNILCMVGCVIFLVFAVLVGLGILAELVWPKLTFLLQ